MRHRNNVPKLKREASHRNALIRNLIQSLVLHERIVTTDAKAKALQNAFESMMSSLKGKEVFNQIRDLKEVFYTETASRKVMDVLLDRFKDRASGYTRRVKVGIRKGDSASLVLIELV